MRGQAGSRGERAHASNASGDNGCRRQARAQPRVLPSPTCACLRLFHAGAGSAERPHETCKDCVPSTSQVHGGTQAVASCEGALEGAAGSACAARHQPGVRTALEPAAAFITEGSHALRTPRQRSKPQPADCISDCIADSAPLRPLARSAATTAAYVEQTLPSLLLPPTPPPPPPPPPPESSALPPQPQPPLPQQLQLAGEAGEAGSRLSSAAAAAAVMQQKLEQRPHHSDEHNGKTAVQPAKTVAVSPADNQHGPGLTPPRMDTLEVAAADSTQAR